MPLRKNAVWRARASAFDGQVRDSSLISRISVVWKQGRVSSTVRWSVQCESTHTIGHRLVLDAARHTARHLWSFNLVLVELLDIPELIVRMAEDPDAGVSAEHPLSV